MGPLIFFLYCQEKERERKRERERETETETERQRVTINPRDGNVRSGFVSAFNDDESSDDISVNK